MTAPNVRFVSFGRFADNILLGSYSPEKNFESNFKKEAIGLMGKLRLLNLGPDERQKCNTQNGAWHCYVDLNGVVYLVLCSQTYPERHAYALIHEAQEELEKIPEYQDASEEIMTKQGKRFLPSLIRKYDDLSSIDIIHAAHEKADQVKNVMGDNLKNMMDNMQNMETLEKKSSNMQDQARMFADDSTKLARIMRMRAIKMKIVICLLIVAILLYIIIPIVISATSTATVADNVTSK